MSQEKFNEAKNSLAFSQTLMGQMGGQPGQEDMVQQGDISGDEQPQMPPEQAQPPVESSPQAGIEEAVQKAMDPYMKKIEELLTKKSEEPQEAVLKVEGTLEPKE